MESSLDNYKLSCQLLGHSMDVRAVAAGGVTANGGQVILSGSRDKTTKVWKPNGNEYIEAVTFQDHVNFISYIQYLPRERWICTASNDTTICIYKEDGLVPILTLKGHESTVCALAGGLEQQSILSGSWDKTARIWHVDQLGGITSIVLQGHEAAVWAVATLATQKKFVTGGADKNIYYWNTKGEKLRLLKGHTDCIRGLLPLSDNTLISCGNDAVIRHWNDDGECIQQLYGHTNYIYAIALNKALGEHVIVSCGEDGTLRMWNTVEGTELGEAILHPAVSVWSVACLTNGDIITGSSDGIVRVFTKEPTRMAKGDVLNAFHLAVSTRKMQMGEEIGGIKKTDLPGPEALLSNGTQEGQTKMVRHPDGSIKCYNWELGKWNLIGDVTGALGGSQATSGKKLYEGKEYDYVFDVDISDTQPAIKLPYNRGEDPWHAAQEFIHRNNLPQAYLDQVANFIIKNSYNTGVTSHTSSLYQDPFTGGARYVPGFNNSNFQTTGNVDPFTGPSSYSITSNESQPTVNANYVKGTERHFPVTQYVTFDICDAQKVLKKMIEFNNQLPSSSTNTSEEVLNSVIQLTENNAMVDNSALQALMLLLQWPVDKLFPVLDVLRLAVRSETIFKTLHNNYKFLDIVLPHLTSSAPNQLMIVRALANMMVHDAGRSQIELLLPQFIEHINSIRAGSTNLQLAIATFYLNVTIAQTLGLAKETICYIVTKGIIELFKWATDLEAYYRSMQAIGNLTTTPHGQETTALLVSVDYVMDKLRELTNSPQTGSFTKLNSVGHALLAAF